MARRGRTEDRVPGEKAQGGERSSALSKALAVLDAVIAFRRPVGLPDLAAHLGQPRQSVHRILLQLEAAGLLQRDIDRSRFHVGPGMTRLALQSLAAANETAPIRALLGALVEEVDETCNIGILDGREVIYVERVECHWPLRAQLQAGSRVPAHCTAIGKLLLARQPEETRRALVAAAPLKRYTDRTITDPKRLEAELAAIRDQGYSVNEQEYTVGMLALAVPIEDEAGQAVAALAVHAPAARLSREQAVACIPRLQATAAKLAPAWGFASAKQAQGQRGGGSAAA